jgi:threonine synthase
MDAIAKKLEKKYIGKGKNLIHKYKWFLPIEKPNKVVTLNEGNTPFIKCKGIGTHLNLRNVYLKDETRNPTGSFKDRPITVGVTLAVHQGYKKVVTASTGNAAASLSAYAAKAGIECFVLVPNKVSLPKLFQILSYGARIISIDGSVDDCLNLLRKTHEELGWYPIPTSSLFNPYQIEGSKTIVYEVCKQNNWKVPDWVILPVGGGDCITASWKAFKEFYELGFIDKLPRMVGVQASGCNPLARAYKNGVNQVKPVEPRTIASSILVKNPPTGFSALKTVRESNGLILDVSDDEILTAQKLLASTEGVFAEPASATTIAALKKLASQNKIDRDDNVVCIITGTGLKQPEVFSLIHRKPVKIKPNIQEIKKMVNLKA